MGIRLYAGLLALVLFLGIHAQVYAQSGAAVEGSDGLVPKGMLKINGKKIAYYQSEGTAGPAIFFIHGNTTSANAFARIFKSDFGRTRRLYAIDMPGYGRSDRLLLYNAGVFADYTAQAVRLLKADKGILVGWSFGGDVALQAGTRLPDIKGYFMFGTSPFGGSLPLPLPFYLSTESPAGIATTYVYVPVLTNPQIDQLVTNYFRPGYSPIPSFFYNDGYNTAGTTRSAIALMALGLDITFKSEIPLLQNLEVPIAILYADKDSYFRLSYLEQVIVPAAPTLWGNNIQIINNSGHASQWEQPDQIISLLTNFIGSL